MTQRKKGCRKYSVMKLLLRLVHHQASLMLRSRQNPCSLLIIIPVVVEVVDSVGRVEVAGLLEEEGEDTPHLLTYM